MRVQILLAIWLAGAVSSFAGEQEEISTPVILVPTPTAPSWSANFESDYTFGSRFKDVSSFGSQSEFHYSTQASRRFSLADGWFFKIGFAEEQFQFSRSNSFLPYSLTKVAGQIGFGSSLTDSLRWEADVSPGVYFTRDHITTNSFDAPAALIGTWQINPRFRVSLGVAGRYFSQNPVLPVGGLTWEITDRWKLEAGLPKTRVTYVLTPGSDLYVGAEFQQGGFRNGPTNDRRTNNAVLTYTDERVGGGLILQPIRGVKLDLSAGFNFQREFNYFHSGPVFRTKGAPYLQTAFHL